MSKKEDILLKLKEDLNIRRFADGTVNRYCYVISKFLNFLDINDDEIYDIDEYDAISYLKYLTEERNYTSSSYNNINSIIKFFLEVTLEKDIKERRLPSVKLEERLKYIPTSVELKDIIDKITNLKYKLFFELMFGSGLRCWEVAYLKISSVDSVNMKLKFIGKNNKERITVLPNKTLNDLREFCIQEHIYKGTTQEYLFVGRNNPHICEATVYDAVKTIKEKFKIKKNITPHSLRRSFATYLIRMGVKIEVVKELMGHKSLTTTLGYAKVVYYELEIKNTLDSESYETYNSRNIQ